MIQRKSLLLTVAAAIAVILTFVLGSEADRDPPPNFEGVWNSATATPLQRPQELADKPFFTLEEAAALIDKKRAAPPRKKRSRRKKSK